MGPSEKTQHAIRRSTRLPLEIPVVLTSRDPTIEFSAPCQTTLVNAHGCGLIAPSSPERGMPVRLEIVSAKRHTTARVAEVVALGSDPETWLVGLELDAPGNFWGIEYAPADWKIEEPSVLNSGAAGANENQTKSKAAGKRAPRWRLTDISASACYLETASPFPEDTPLLLSVRALDHECLLDGVVRLSHPNAGMGVEFTGTPFDEQRTRVEELISRLTSTREVPKIFVGRNEVAGRGGASSSQAGSGGTEPGVPDPLLDLIRSSRALPPEQFLSDLRAQRLGKRRDPRIDVGLPVLLSGTDVNGRPLDQRVSTINVSRRGALLAGIHGMLVAGDLVSLARLQKKEDFRVAWVGSIGTPSAGQIGVAAVDANTTFWMDVLDSAEQGAEMAGNGGNEGASDSSG